MTNTSIYAAFERMWQHILGKFNNYVSIEIFNSHITNKENPHEVTAEQVGTYTKDEIDDKLSLAGEVKILDSDDNVTGIIEVPVLSVERVDGGTKITATDNNGVTTSIIYDGPPGTVTFENLTEADKDEIKSYVDNAILGGAW